MLENNSLYGVCDMIINRLHPQGVYNQTLMYGGANPDSAGRMLLISNSRMDRVELQ